MAQRSSAMQVESNRFASMQVNSTGQGDVADVKKGIRDAITRMLVINATTSLRQGNAAQLLKLQNFATSDGAQNPFRAPPGTVGNNEGLDQLVHLLPPNLANGVIALTRLNEQVSNRAPSAFCYTKPATIEKLVQVGLLSIIDTRDHKYKVNKTWKFMKEGDFFDASNMRSLTGLVAEGEETLGMVMEGDIFSGMYIDDTSYSMTNETYLQLRAEQQAANLTSGSVTTYKKKTKIRGKTAEDASTRLGKRVAQQRGPGGIRGSEKAKHPKWKEYRVEAA